MAMFDEITSQLVLSVIVKSSWLLFVKQYRSVFQKDKLVYSVKFEIRLEYTSTYQSISFIDNR